MEGASQRQPTNGDAQDGTRESTMIDREDAIRIARERAATSYGSLERYNIVPCDQGVFWRVLLEPASPSSDREGIEYVISKQGGRIISQRELPLLTTSSVDGEESSRSVSTSREDALAIARRDAAQAYSSLESYNVTACELTNVWRVIYSPEGGLDGGGPEYVIDKRTGRIINKRYYQ